jgi:hypothetical protein
VTVGLHGIQVSAGGKVTGPPIGSSRTTDHQVDDSGERGHCLVFFTQQYIFEGGNNIISNTFYFDLYW